MQLINDDCIKAMSEMEEDSVDSIVCDPPYGLGFMGNKWDKLDSDFHDKWATEALRVLKPGGHMLAFGGTKTFHRLTVAVEDAGFEIRDCLMWLYGTGFPKSLNVSKAIDKMNGNWRGKAADKISGNVSMTGGNYGSPPIGKPISEEAKKWSGYGTGLKPAWEPIILARKPLSEKNVASNVLEYGTGALNIDGCRIEVTAGDNPRLNGKGVCNNRRPVSQNTVSLPPMTLRSHISGRYPANLLLDEEVGKMLDQQSGNLHNAGSGTLQIIRPAGKPYIMNGTNTKETIGKTFLDNSGASRFFYCAKTSSSERNAGLEHLTKKQSGSLNGQSDTANLHPITKNQNFHPTVKPIKLMTYLVHLVTPQGGTVLDPFMGSGSTGCVAIQEGFDFIGIEKDKEYMKIARARIDKTTKANTQLSFTMEVTKCKLY
jgi:site-specific DNA-methyltransferase (adenine-specific)